MNILILQKNTNKAGAQHALFRILSSNEFNQHNIVVICSLKGWLTEELKKLNINNIILKYPSIKSISGKLFRISRWTNNIHKTLIKMNFNPDIIFANNHIEFPYVLKIHKKFELSKTLVYFRDSYMKKNDFLEFKCDMADIKITVSKVMKDKLPFCDNVEIIQDGLLQNEFYPIKEKNHFFPKKVLLIGTPSLIKGWDIFFKAIKNIYLKNNTIIFEKIVCTGIPNNQQLKKYNLTNAEIKKFNINFSEKFDNLAQEARGYDLAIFPSRKESFGLSPLEILAAGIPLISSKTGIIENVIKETSFLFEANSVKSLESTILNLYTNWNDINFNLKEMQNAIRTNYLIQGEIKKLITMCSKEINK